MAPPKYFFKVHLVGRFVPLVGVISRLVESPLEVGLSCQPHLVFLSLYHYLKNKFERNPASQSQQTWLDPTIPRPPPPHTHTHTRRVCLKLSHRKSTGESGTLPNVKSFS